MKHNRTVRAALLLAIALALCLYFFGCDDDPTTGPVDPEPKDYVVYFWDATSDLDFFGFHPLTGVMDTFTVPYYPMYGITVSADGRRLYCRTSTLVGVVDMATLGVITELPYTAHGFAVSPDNQLIAILDTGLVILNASDYTTVFADPTTENFWCTFSSNNRTLYCWGGADRYSVVEVKLDAGYAMDTTSFSDDAGIVNFLPALDGSRWFLYRHGSWSARFEVYDPSTDSIVFRNYLDDTYGAMQLTPDGRYLFYTELGNHLDYDGPPYFTVYDIARNRIKMQVSTVGVADGKNPIYMALGGAMLTPDGRWLVLGSINLPALLLFDTEKMTITEYVDLTNNLVASPTCQLIP